jgi:hypothetical protein
MKKSLLFILAIIIVQTLTLRAQNTLDNDKLLELYQTQRYSEAATYLQTVYKEDTQDPKEYSVWRI